MKLEQILAAVGGELAQTPDPAREKNKGLTLNGGVCIDSRKAAPGDLFVCLKGEQSDGHDFAAAAVRAGASAVLAERDPFLNESARSEIAVPLILTPDCRAALGRLARAWRDGFGGRVVGVTGSAGKTTVKEILAHILSLSGATARNPLNLNNQIGLPQSMLAANGDESFWVMELGISQAGDMDELGPILAPDLALLLNVGPAHTEGLGNKGVAQHKAALLKYVRPEGAALVSADYPDLVREARAVCPAAAYFSVEGKQLKYRASYLGLTLGADGRERGSYRLQLDGRPVDVNSALTGCYGAENIVAAAAAAHMLGLDPELIARGVSEAVLPAQRFARMELPGWSLIDDSYNANPLSSARVLEAVSELARDKDLVCVMGEMLELGEDSEEEHAILGRNLAASGVKAVFWHGGMAPALSKGLKAGHYSGLFSPISQAEDFLPLFREWAELRRDPKDGIILFKGSRGNRLERLVQAFVNSKGAEHAL